MTLPRRGGRDGRFVRTIETLETRRLLASAPVTFGNGLNDGVYGIETLDDGSSVVVGTFGGTVDFQPGSAVTALTARGQSDIFVARYSVRNKLLWVGQMGGAGGRVDEDPLYSPLTATIGEFINKTGPAPNRQGEYVTSLEVRDGVVYIAGAFQATADFDPGPGEFNRRSVGYHDAFVVRLNVEGGSLINALTFGGPFDDDVKDLAVAANGNVIATGLFTREADFDPTSGVARRVADGRDDLFVASYSPSGRLVWLYNAGGDAVDLSERDSGESVALDSAGNVYVTGTFSGRADFDPSEGRLRIENVDKTDGFLLRLSPRGKLDYVKTFGGDEFDGGNHLAIDANDRLYLSGYFSETVNLNIDGPAMNFTAREDDDARDTDDDDDEGIEQFDAFLGQYSLTGQANWIRQIGGDDYELLGQMKLDDQGVLLSGSFAGKIEFYGAKSVSTLDSVEGDDDFDDDNDRESSYDAFVVRYSAAGGFVAAQKVGGNGDDWGNAISVNRSRGTVGFGGIFRNTASFALDGSGRNVRSNGLQDGFVMSLDLAADLT